jgi:hypothetical protein
VARRFARRRRAQSPLQRPRPFRYRYAPRLPFLGGRSAESVRCESSLDIAGSRQNSPPRCLYPSEALGVGSTKIEYSAGLRSCKAEITGMAPHPSNSLLIGDRVPLRFSVPASRLRSRWSG